MPGEYKTQPNKVQTSAGEIFKFVDPVEVEPEMRRYVGLLNGPAPSGSAELLFHLARIHHAFLFIHPFDDGNGRIARLLLNYVLLKLGYPPIVIRTESKRDYLSALHRADTEERDYSELATLIGNELRWSLEIGIKAGKGESIEEPSDIEKQISLYAAQNAQDGPPAASREIISSVWTSSLHALFKKIEQKSAVLKKLFSVVELRNAQAGSNWEQITADSIIGFSQGGHIPLILYCEHYNGRNVQPFNQTFPLTVAFDKYSYQINLANLLTRTMQYSERLAPSEIDALVSAFLKVAFEVIIEKAEKK